MKQPINIIRYLTLRSCLEAYGLNPNSKGYWEWADEEGVKHRTRKSTALKSIKSLTCWGWAEDKARIHVWIGKRATLKDVTSLLAHEFGHLRRPFHRNVFDEEQKASKYQSVAVTAISAAQDLLNVDK